MISNQEKAIKSLIVVTMLALIFSMFSPLFAEEAMAASSRAASVVEVNGTAYLKKAGGSKPYRIFKKMTVNQGDTIMTEAKSSVVLELLDRDDEVTIGENSEVYVADLVEDTTGLKVWSGNVSSAVSKLSGSETYKIDTPNATMGVRGTHFFIGVDPETGETIMHVFAGIVESRNNSNRSQQTDDSDATFVYPSMQVSFFDFEDDVTGELFTEDYVTSIVTNVDDPSVIEALLRNKRLIDEENDELARGGDVPTIDPSNEADLERYRRNVENALFWILQQSVQNGTYTEEQLQDIIDAANANIPSGFDLNREIPPFDRSAGIDPEEEERRRQQREAAERRRQQQQQQQEQRREEIRNNNQDLLDKIQKRQEEQQRQNQQAAEERQQQATDRMMEQLTEEQRRALEERLNRREQEANNRDRSEQRPTQPSPTPPSPSEPSNPSPTYRPTVQLVSDELSDSNWERDQLVVDVKLNDFPPTFYAAEFHLLFKDEHFATMEDDTENLLLESNVSDVFKEAAEAYKAETGLYTWENEAEAVPTTEVVYTVTSVGDVVNARIDRVTGKLLFSIPLHYIGEELSATGTIRLAEVIFVDRQGNRLPYQLNTIDLPYEISAN